jgi:hypothetical protein
MPEIQSDESSARIGSDEHDPLVLDAGHQADYEDWRAPGHGPSTLERGRTAVAPRNR